MRAEAQALSTRSTPRWRSSAVSSTGIAPSPLDELNNRVEDPKLWDDPKQAQSVMQERRRLEEAIDAVRTIERERQDTAELMDMAELEGDVALVDDGVESLAALAERAERDKIKALLAGEADSNDTYVEINAGAGGTEEPGLGRDAAAHVHALGRTPRHEGRAGRLSRRRAGRIKSATLLLKGENAYGYVKTESGVHRLVRISPYDSSARPPHQLLQRLGLSGDRRQYLGRDQRQRAADRHLSRLGRGRAAHQHHRFGGAYHPFADRHRRPVPEPALAAQE